MSINTMQTNIHTKGFTLVETLIAITVLILVVIGPVTIAQQGIKNARYASEEMTATFLAQEAMEGVRSFRDVKALEAIDSGGSVDTWLWVSQLDNDCKQLDVGCEYDNKRNDPGGTSRGDFTPCDAGDGRTCTLDVLESGEYAVNGGTPSIYRRKVFVTSPGYPPDLTVNSFVQVRVEVSWNSQLFGGAEKKVVLLTHLYDHFQRFNNN